MLRSALALLLVSAALPVHAQPPGIRADEAEYKLEVKPVALKVGQAAPLELAFLPQGGWHWNKEYPAKLELAVPEGITVDRQLKQSAGDFQVAGDKVTASLTLTAASEGTRSATLKGKIGLCDDKVCIIKKVEVGVPLLATP